MFLAQLCTSKAFFGFIEMFFQNLKILILHFTIFEVVQTSKFVLKYSTQNVAISNIFGSRSIIIIIIFFQHCFIWNKFSCSVITRRFCFIH